jgi:TIR domain
MSSGRHNPASLLRPFKQVFLCHSSLDTNRAKALYGGLKETGFRPWMDAMNLLPGQDWAFEITKAIEASAAMLVLLTRDSTRHLGYVETEIANALAVADKKPKAQSSSSH